MLIDDSSSSSASFSLFCPFLGDERPNIRPSTIQNTSSTSHHGHRDVHFVHKPLVQVKTYGARQSIPCAWCGHVGRRACTWVPCDPRTVNIKPRQLLNASDQQAPLLINLRSLHLYQCSSTICHHQHRSCRLPASFGNDNRPILRLLATTTVLYSSKFGVIHQTNSPLWRADVHALPMAPSTPTSGPLSARTVPRFNVDMLRLAAALRPRYWAWL